MTRLQAGSIPEALAWRANLATCAADRGAHVPARLTGIADDAVSDSARRHSPRSHLSVVTAHGRRATSSTSPTYQPLRNTRSQQPRRPPDAWPSLAHTARRPSTMLTTTRRASRCSRAVLTARERTRVRITADVVLGECCLALATQRRASSVALPSYFFLTPPLGFFAPPLLPGPLSGIEEWCRVLGRSSRGQRTFGELRGSVALIRRSPTMRSFGVISSVWVYPARSTALTIAAPLAAATAGEVLVETLRRMRWSSSTVEVWQKTWPPFRSIASNWNRPEPLRR